MSHKNKHRKLEKGFEKGMEKLGRDESRVPPPNPAEDISLKGKPLDELDVQEGQERMQGEGAGRPTGSKATAKSGVSTPGKDAGLNPQSSMKQAPNDEL